MARSWGELLGETGAGAEPEEERSGFFSRLRDSLGKSRRALVGQLAAATFDPDDDEAWERLEEALIFGDVGVPTTAELVRRLEARDDLAEGLEGALAEEIEALMGERPTNSWRSGPTAPGPTSSAPPAEGILLRWRSTPSRPPSRATATSSSSTRPAACTRTRT